MDYSTITPIRTYFTLHPTVQYCTVRSTCVAVEEQLSAFGTFRSSDPSFFSSIVLKRREDSYTYPLASFWSGPLCFTFLKINKSIVSLFKPRFRCCYSLHIKMWQSTTRIATTTSLQFRKPCTTASAVATTVAAVFAAGSSLVSGVSNGDSTWETSAGHDTLCRDRWVACEQQERNNAPVLQDDDYFLEKVHKPSWLRQQISGLVPLGFPRIPTKTDLELPRHVIQSRQKDDERLRNLYQKFGTVGRQSSHQHPPKEEMAQIMKQIYSILYGPGVSPQDRQDFLARYGCTGYTAEILHALLELGNRENGIVEIGAGHGQWSRALNDLHALHASSSSSSPRKGYTFCLAYDDQSDLPLDPRIYSPRTKVYHDFFGKVEKCDSSLTVLSQWQCRNRVLLLVFPTAQLASTAIKMFPGKTLVYVGEGKGGANAGGDFFDEIEKNWILVQSYQPNSFGTKGYEKVQVFHRRSK